MAQIVGETMVNVLKSRGYDFAIRNPQVVLTHRLPIGLRQDAYAFMSDMLSKWDGKKLNTKSDCDFYTAWVICEVCGFIHIGYVIGLKSECVDMIVVSG